MTGRRAVARGTAESGITTLAVDGVEHAVAAHPVESGPPDEACVGIDRFYRAWTKAPTTTEELWMAPLGLPLAVRWTRREGEVAADLWWAPSDEGSTTSRFRRMAGTWATLDRSWARELAETALISGGGVEEAAFAWARARVLSAVRTGPDRKGIQLGAVEPSSLDVTWLGLALCSMGRADRVEDLLRRVSDMRQRAHLDQWVHRWNGSDGPQPPEGAGALPDWLEIPGTTDGPLDATAGSGEDAIAAAAYCCRTVDQGLGLRPDPRFGRVRFAPDERLLKPLPGRPLQLSSIGIGRSNRATRLRLGWSVAESDVRRHTWSVEPEAGSVPLFGVFEPLFRADEVHGVTLDGSDIEVEAAAEAPGWMRVRFQCPLDAPRAIGVTVS